MSPAAAETLAQALRAQDCAAAAALGLGASARARAMAEWFTGASRRARLLDGAIDRTRHCLAHDSPERTCAEAWVRSVIDDVLPERCGGAGPALKRTVEACAPVAHTLVRARLALETLASARPAVLERLDRLCAALGEDRTLWHLPVARLPALDALPEAAWLGLARAPAWAVVRALGETTAPDSVYRRDLETLAQDLGRWAAPRVAAVARTERIRLARAPDPAGVAALLAEWRWPAAEPPLAMVAAYADTGRTGVADDAWAAALSLAPCGDVPLWIGAGIEADSGDIRRARLDSVAQRGQPHASRHLSQGLDPRQTLLLADDSGRFQRPELRQPGFDDPLLLVDGPVPEHAGHHVADDAFGGESESHQDAAKGLVAAPLLGDRDPDLVLADHALGDQLLVDALPRPRTAVRSGPGALRRRDFGGGAGKAIASGGGHVPRGGRFAPCPGLGGERASGHRSGASGAATAASAGGRTGAGSVSACNWSSRMRCCTAADAKPAARLRARRSASRYRPSALSGRERWSRLTARL